MKRLAVDKACRVLSSAGVIAYPTEAVWGLGCDPFSQQATLRLLQIKRRPVEKGMILVAATIEQLDFILSALPAEQRDVLKKGWSGQAKTGPVTYLVQDSQDVVPWWIKGDHSSVALRVSSHPLAQQLCREFGGPVVSTSANLAGRPAIRSRVLLEQQLGAQVDYVLPGSLGGASKPSQIIDLATGQVRRAA